jgi:hypothetical protein
MALLSLNPQTPEAELMKHARLEWPVETVHWLLDAHFKEDFCRVGDANIKRNLNFIRKIVLNSIKAYKEINNSKRSISHIMLGCLLEADKMLI